MDFFDLFKQNTKSKRTRFNSDNRVSNMYNQGFLNNPNAKWQPPSRTMKGRDLQQQRFDQSMNSPWVKFSNGIGDFLSNTPVLSDIQNWMNDTKLVGGQKLSDPGTYVRGNGDKILAGILGGPFGSLALKAFDNLNQTRYDTRFTGGGQSGARLSGSGRKNWFDLVSDIIKRSGIVYTGGRR